MDKGCRNILLCLLFIKTFYVFHKFLNYLNNRSDHKYYSTSGYPTFWNHIIDSIIFKEDHLNLPKVTNAHVDPAIKNKQPIKRIVCSNVYLALKLLYNFSVSLMLDMYSMMDQLHLTREFKLTLLLLTFYKNHGFQFHHYLEKRESNLRDNNIKLSCLLNSISKF